MQSPSSSIEGGGGGEGVVSEETNEFLIHSITSNSLVSLQNICPCVISRFKKLQLQTLTYFVPPILVQISDIILSYLTYGDMLAVSRISRDFLQMIRTSRKFNSYTILTVRENTAQEIGKFCKSPGRTPLH